MSMCVCALCYSVSLSPVKWIKWLGLLMYKYSILSAFYFLCANRPDREKRILSFSCKFQWTFENTNDFLRIEKRYGTFSSSAFIIKLNTNIQLTISKSVWMWGTSFLTKKKWFRYSKDFFLLKVVPLRKILRKNNWYKIRINMEQDQWTLQACTFFIKRNTRLSATRALMAINDLIFLKNFAYLPNWLFFLWGKVTCKKLDKYIDILANQRDVGLFFRLSFQICGEMKIMKWDRRVMNEPRRKMNSFEGWLKINGRKWKIFFCYWYYYPSFIARQIILWRRRRWWWIMKIIYRKKNNIS